MAFPSPKPHGWLERSKVFPQGKQAFPQTTCGWVKELRMRGGFQSVLEKLEVFTRIGDSGTFHECERREVVGVCPVDARDVGDRHSPNREGIGDQKPVTPPGHRFGAQNRPAIARFELLE